MIKTKDYYCGDCEHIKPADPEITYGKFEICCDYYYYTRLTENKKGYLKCRDCVLHMVKEENKTLAEKNSKLRKRLSEARGKLVSDNAALVACNLRLRSKNDIMSERLTAVIGFALNICGCPDCAGDDSVGIPPCSMWQFGDVDANGNVACGSCMLEAWQKELKE